MGNLTSQCYDSPEDRPNAQSPYVTLVLPSSALKGRALVILRAAPQHVPAQSSHLLVRP